MLRIVRLQRSSCAISLRRARFDTGMRDGERRNHHLLADHAHSLADRMVLGEMPHERRETADFFERIAPHRDGLSEAGPRQPERQAGHHAGQKLVVGRLDRQARPEPRIGLSAIHAGDEAHTRLLQFADHVAQIVRARRSRRCRRTPARRARACGSMFRMLLILRFGPYRRASATTVMSASGCSVRSSSTVLQRRVGRIVHAEQKLHGPRVILLTEARQIGEQRPLVAVQRLDDRDRRKAGRLGHRPREETPDQRAGQHRVADAEHSAPAAHA